MRIFRRTFGRYGDFAASLQKTNDLKFQERQFQPP